MSGLYRVISIVEVVSYQGSAFPLRVRGTEGLFHWHLSFVIRHCPELAGTGQVCRCEESRCNRDDVATYGSREVRMDLAARLFEHAGMNYATGLQA
jgi:hypothetical protein